MTCGLGDFDRSGVVSRSRAAVGKLMGQPERNVFRSGVEMSPRQLEPKTTNDEPSKDASRDSSALRKHRGHERREQQEKRMLLTFRHGLGDAVQLTSVIAHLRRYCPEWAIEVSLLKGKHTLFKQLADAVFLLDRGEPADPTAYNRVFDLQWREVTESYSGCPSTKAEKCLREVFGLEPIADLCRYRISIGEHARSMAARYLESLAGPPMESGKYKTVLVHYEGNSAAREKNLDHQTARNVCEQAVAAEYVPIILDWDKRSPLPGDGRIFCPGANHWLWKGYGTGDGETLAALIELSSLFVGIDSGPSKVAAATATPAIAVWTGHHPIHYHGLAENVLHLVPDNHLALIRGDVDNGRLPFDTYFRSSTYSDLHAALADQIETRLRPRVSALVHSRGFSVRRNNGRQDEIIIADVFDSDCYDVEHLPLPREVVIDIGAHIGTFAARWRKRNPNSRIIAVEACPENIAALKANVGHFAEILHSACTYEPDVALLNTVWPSCANTGGSRVVRADDVRHYRQEAQKEDNRSYLVDERPLPTITLEQIMTRFNLSSIDILKLDCEGSEFSILGKCDSRTLEKIAVILGEYHGRARFEELVVSRFKDWDVQMGITDPYGNDGGLFWMFNPSSPLHDSTSWRAGAVSCFPRGAKQM